MGLHREDVFNNLNIVHIRGARFRPVLGTLTLSVQFCNQNLHNSAKLSGICSKDSNVRSSLLPFSMAFLKYAFTAVGDFPFMKIHTFAKLIAIFPSPLKEMHL